MRKSLCFVLLLMGAVVAALPLNDEDLPMPEFNCPSVAPSATVPTSVHKLRPGDIKVVAALGDSITAGFGLNGLKAWIGKDLAESRGKSWSIGGDAGAVTIPNILKNYSPSIVGASVGEHFVEVCYGPICPPLQHKPSIDKFNGAQSGAMAQNLIAEAKYLVKQIKSNKKVNLSEDWKLLTLFIGANDLCLVGCNNITTLLKGIDRWEANVKASIEEVRAQIPRVFVNLVQIFNVSRVYELSRKTSWCTNVHRVLPIECVCAFTPSALGGDKLRYTLDMTAQEYNRRLERIAASYEGKYEDFAVVAQPAFKDGTLDDMPPGLLSKLDCFHPSVWAHQQMAMHLWNNMVTPRSEKRTDFNIRDTWICPSEDTLLYTN
eukprot:Colp12_sorted_trinity150504_noHs@850